MLRSNFAVTTRRPARRVDDGEIIGRVPEEFRLGLRHIGDALPVGAPSRRAVRTFVYRQLAGLPAVCFLVCRDDPDIGVVIAVGVFRPVADESDFRAVGPPLRSRILIVSRGQLERFAVALVDDVKVRSRSVEIADAVFLELPTVDNPGPRFLLLAVLACKTRFLVRSKPSTPCGTSVYRSASPPLRLSV